MGGFFGMTSTRDCVPDVFFGVDYHSHLGMKLAGMVAYNEEIGLQREIHHINNSPFRTKFENICNVMKGNSALGCISDTFPQPLLIRSNLGRFAICVTGIINNADELTSRYLSESSGHFDVMTGGRVNGAELVASLISQKSSFVEGLTFVQDIVEGTVAVLILKEDGHIIAMRDRYGRLPMIIGRGEDCYCVTFESFAYEKLGCVYEKELGPGEIVDISSDGIVQLAPPGKEMRICAFLWAYYGYPTSTYEGVNVEMMRCRNGSIMAENDRKKGMDEPIDYVCGVPDSGTPHAIGYSNASHIPFARPFIKYTPTWSRSFMPSDQGDRKQIAKMKQIPVKELIQGKNLLFVDDSIVRGTQLRETSDFLYENGAKSVHMRFACPPIMHTCKFLNFSRSTNEMELFARRIILKLEGEEGFLHLEEYADGETERGKNLRKAICEEFNYDSLEFQSLEGVIKAIGIDSCKLCTYCWTGKE